MSKSGKLMLGFLSILPLLLLAVYMVFFINFFISIFRNVQQEEVLSGMIMSHMLGMMAVIGSMGLISLGLKIYFIIHAVNNTVIDSTEQIVWVLVFIFAGTIGFPVYWYMRIWKDLLPAKNN